LSGTGRLAAIVLEVSDLARSAAFYRDAIGLVLHVGADNEAGDDRWISGDHVAISWSDGAYLHFALYQAKTSQPSTMTQVGFMTEDLKAAHNRAVAAGAEVVHEPRPEPWGRTARYRDPDGNIVGLTQA
jgi:predicted enzyme related to lactoylglutathione lyase